MRRAGIALGSNLGDKINLVRLARAELSGLRVPDSTFLCSPLYETDPVGCPAGSDNYLNAVVELAWEGDAETLLERCQEIETLGGRVRSGVRCEPRTVDVDLLYLGDLVINTPRLVLPHPRAHLRRFVLRPLADICPNLRLPGCEFSVIEQLSRLETDEPEPRLVLEQW